MNAQLRDAGPRGQNIPAALYEQLLNSPNPKSPCQRHVLTGTGDLEDVGHKLTRILKNSQLSDAKDRVLRVLFVNTRLLIVKMMKENWTFTNTIL